MSQPSKLPSPAAELHKKVAIAAAYNAVKSIVKQTLNDDSSVGIAARNALSHLYQATHGTEISSHHKQIVLRSLVARRDTTWMDIGALDESDVDQLVLNNLWLMEVPPF